jgi:hypothetical protein
LVLSAAMTALVSTSAPLDVLISMAPCVWVGSYVGRYIELCVLISIGPIEAWRWTWADIGGGGEEGCAGAWLGEGGRDPKHTTCTPTHVQTYARRHTHTRARAFVLTGFIAARRSALMRW